MNIIIAGGSGHLGNLIAKALHQQGSHPIILSRKPQAGPMRTVPWDGQTLGSWRECLEGADCLINLAGKSVDCRYHAANRKRLVDSRILSTKVLGQAMKQAKNPPPCWLQMSTATIYQHTFGQGNDEATGIIGGNEPHAPSSWRFSIDLARAWEKEARRWKSPKYRQVLLRTAMVMSPYPRGVFKILQRLSRLGLGGKAGSGLQWISWLHHQDFVRAIQWLIQNPKLDGIVNLAAPNPMRNQDFMARLRQTLKQPLGLPSPAWLLSIAAFFMRTETELLLKSRKVLPGRLLEHGFRFDHPEWDSACEDLCTAKDFSLDMSVA